MTAQRLLQVSGVITDLVYRVRTVPKPGEEAAVRGFQVAAGGGFNAMLAAKRAGLDVSYGGALGTGPFADIARSALKDASIPALRPHDELRDQGLCTVLVDDAGERTFIAREGADGHCGAGDLAALLVADFDWILLSGYALSYAGNQAAFAHWLDQIPPDAPLVFDPSPVVEAIPDGLLRSALGKAAWISANATEAEFLTGATGPAAAAEALARRGNGRGGALVRSGADGCHVAAAAGIPAHLPGLPVQAIDTNGAGDTHIGSFIAGLAEGWDPLEAARFANAAAALSATREGPATAPERREILAVLAQQKDPILTAT